MWANISLLMSLLKCKKMIITETKKVTDSGCIEKTRYSDEELLEFRNLINSKIAKARKDYEFYKNSVINENGIDDTCPTFKILEEGNTTMSKEESGILAGRQLKIIEHLEAARFRIENKTYGICRITRKLIPKERLVAVPHATLCVEAKN